MVLPAETDPERLLDAVLDVVADEEEDDDDNDEGDEDLDPN
jgi:hypothetical protein